MDKEDEKTKEKSFEERSRLVGRDKNYGAGGMKLPGRVTFKAPEKVPEKEKVEGV